MKSLMNCWKEGLDFLKYDDLISFYVFFTIIFAECILLRIFGTPLIVKPFTIVLLGYVIDILLCSFIRGIFEGTRIEVAVTILYPIVFIVLFIIGCFINAKISIMMTFIPLIITFKLCMDRECGCWTTETTTKFHQHQFVVIAGPFITFTISILMIPTIPLVLKIIIPILYILCAPFIPHIEDSMAGLTMFELFYDI